tara:strand:- start:184 stop:564 length:381 start_codon:yes stop_codon:yes gene_type:complete
MTTVIYICGLYSFLFGVFHILFWLFFNWKTELQVLSVANRAIMQILNLRLIYYFFFVAILCFIYPIELYTSSLGKAFLAGNALFWLGRTVEQFIFLKINHWKVHVLTCLFTVGIVLFTIPLILNRV